MPIGPPWCQRFNPIRFCLTGAAPNTGATRAASCAAPLRQKRSSLYYILTRPEADGRFDPDQRSWTIVGARVGLRAIFRAIARNPTVFEGQVPETARE